jgi:inner membrane protein
MTAPNHLIGGIVFTGLFCSFFSVNIFENPIFITATLFGSLLPDIDHTKSWIGKAFFPLAKWLSVNYGHRTITHSVFFLVGLCIISLFVEKVFRNDFSVTIILFFSVLSHLIFDMVTLQGIPLFYPFYKNPCVLPANPEMRIRSGNIRQEGIILFIFCFLSFFMQDLFANGFWSTVNNNFNDVKHQIKEYKKSPNVLDITFDYDIYQTHFKGKGTFIQATENEMYILTNHKIITLKKDTPGLTIKLLKTVKTKQQIHEINYNFDEITEVKLNEFLKDKFISNGTIYANFNTSILNNPSEFKKKFQLENKYNLAFKSNISDTLISNKQKRITELELKLKNEENQLINDNKIYYLNLAELSQLKSNLKKNLSDYDLNETKKKIIDLENKVENSHLKTNLMIEEYKNQLIKIKNDKIDNIKYSGTLNYIDVK